MGHLKDIGENYFTHMTVALRFALVLTVIAVVCIVHAFLPFLFKNTASGWVNDLNNIMQTRSKGETDA